MQTPHGIQFPAYRQSVMGSNGVVTSGHPLASQAGIRVLAAGGSAVDAAIATAAALGVVEPEASGIGGDGYMLICPADTGQVVGLNATGVAPAAATRELYVEAGGIPMTGMRSVSIPGLVDGWLLAHQRHGRLTLEQILAPAIGLCEEGFPISYKLAALIRSELSTFAGDPITRGIFTNDGQPIEPGKRLYQRDLGKTLRRIAEQGRGGFYEGELADAIAEFSIQQDGLLTAADLADHRSSWVDPIQVNYRGYEVYEMPPNSSGHVLLQELNMVERFDLASMGCNTAESVHLMVEAKKLAFADREKFLGDPDWVDVPLAGLLSKSYAEEQVKRIDPTRPAVDLAAGTPAAHQDTTCFCVVDREGSAVCALSSIQTVFGSFMVAGNTGILLNNRMTYWHLEEGHPNCLMPGKRVRHTMNPVIVTREGKPFLICGTPGADTQVQTNLQLVTHAIDFGMTPQEAVEAPRWRSLQNPMESTVPHTCEDLLQLEGRFSTEAQKGLANRGHELRILEDWGGPGSAQAIMVDAESKTFMGGSDPRRDGYAVVF